MLELVFKVLLLAGPPLGALIGIHKVKTFWPLAFFTFIGTTITVINLRIAAQLSALKNESSPVPEGPIANSYHLVSWILAIAILAFGIHKMHRLRIAQAVAELLKEED